MIKETESDFGNLFSKLSNAGYLKVRVDRKILDIEEGMRVGRNKKHNIDLVVDRCTIEDTGEWNT